MGGGIINSVYFQIVVDHDAVLARIPNRLSVHAASSIDWHGMLSEDRNVQKLALFSGFYLISLRCIDRSARKKNTAEKTTRYK